MRDHEIVWRNLAVPFMPTLECACGRRFVTDRAWDDYHAHLDAVRARAEVTEPGRR